MQRFLDSLSFSQPYLVGLLIVILVVLFLPGCATASADSAGQTRNFATTAATTAGGAYVGARLAMEAIDGPSFGTTTLIKA